MISRQQFIRFIALIYLLNFALVIQAQNYFNKVIEYSDAALNPMELIKVSTDTFVINTLTNLESKRSAAFLQYDAVADQIDRYDLVGYDPNSSSLLRIDDEYYMYCTDRTNDTASVALVTMNNHFDVLGVHNYSSPAELKFQSRVFNIGNHIYGTSTFVYDNEDNDQKTNVKKLDLDGNVLWDKVYFEDLRNKGDSDYTVSRDTFIYNSNSIRPDVFNEHTLLVKMDTLGNVIWKFETEEQTYLSSPSNVVELSNGQIVLTYAVDVFPSTPITKMLWFDPDGTKLNEREYNASTSPLTAAGRDQFGFENLVEGKGDYFFAHGKYREEEPDSSYLINYGLITKYDNNGDTIWTKRYRHPDFTTAAEDYEIRDLIEQENGDIVCLSVIWRYTDTVPVKVWLFRIDENGCHPDWDCGDYISFSSTSDPAIVYEDLNLYPNPARDLIYVELPETHAGYLEIINPLGKCIQKIKISKNTKRTKINVSNFPSGTFYIKFDNPEETVVYRSSFMVVD